MSKFIENFIEIRSKYINKTYGDLFIYQGWVDETINDDKICPTELCKTAWSLLENSSSFEISISSLHVIACAGNKPDFEILYCNYSEDSLSQFRRQALEYMIVRLNIPSNLLSGKNGIRWQQCPICENKVAVDTRYPEYVCVNCQEDGIIVNGQNIPIDQFKAYKDLYYIGFIRGVACIAHEARFGGTVIEKYSRLAVEAHFEAQRSRVESEKSSKRAFWSNIIAVVSLLVAIASFILAYIK